MDRGRGLVARPRGRHSHAEQPEPGMTRFEAVFIGGILIAVGAVVAKWLGWW